MKKLTEDQIRRLDAYIAREQAARARIKSLARSSFRTWLAQVAARFIPTMWSRISPKKGAAS